MYKRYQGENLYKTRLVNKISSISASGDPLDVFTFTVDDTPINDTGWVIVDFTDPSKRDLIFYHANNNGVLSYYRKDRDLLGTGASSQTHKKSSFVQMNDVAQWLNYLFAQSDDFGYVSDMGANKVQVRGGLAYYNKTQNTILDTMLTLGDGINYIVLDFTDDSFKTVTTVDYESHLLLSKVTVASSDITEIVDNRGQDLHKNKTVIDGLTDVGGNLLYNGVPLGGGAGTGDVVGPSSAVDGNIVTFSADTGKAISDSLVSIKTTLNSSDSEAPTSKAAKTYVDGKGNVSQLVTLGEDINASQIGDNKGSVFFGKSTSISISGGVDTYNFGKTDGLLFIKTKISGATNNILKSIAIDGFTEVGTGPSVTVTFVGISNSHTELSLSASDLTTDFDLGYIYYTAYGEWIVSSGSIVEISFTISSPNTSNYYAVSADVYDTSPSTPNGSYSYINYNWSGISGCSFVVPAELDGGKLTNFVGEFRMDDYQVQLKIEKNGTVIYGPTSYANIPSYTQYSSVLDIDLEEGDKITFYAISNAGAGRTLYRQNVVYSVIKPIIGVEVQDGLDNDKVRLSDSRFDPMSKSDGVVIQPGLTGDNVIMVKSGMLSQTSSIVGAGYYLGNTYTQHGYYSLSSSSYTGDSLAIADSGLRGGSFNSDGTKVFVAGVGNNKIYEYSLSTPYSVATGVFVRDLGVAVNALNPGDVAFNSDGTKMFVLSFGHVSVVEYNLSTGFDISTAVFSQSKNISTEDSLLFGMCFSLDGTKLFIVGFANKKIYKYNLSTGFDISTAVFSQDLSVVSTDAVPQDVAITPDGSRMFLLGAGNDKVYEMVLGTNFDITTVTWGEEFSVTTEDSDPQGIIFSGDGAKMFIMGDATNSILEYNTVSSEEIYMRGGFRGESVLSDVLIGTGVTSTQIELVADSSSEKALTPAAGTICTSASLLTERQTSSTSNVKIKEAKITRGGVYTVSFNIYTPTTNYRDTMIYGQVYMDGVPVGTLQHTTRNSSSSSGQTFTENLQLDGGSLVQLYIRGGNSVVCVGRSFTIKHGFIGYPSTYTVD